MAPLIDEVLREVGRGEDFEAAVEDFASAGGEREFLALALGWADLSWKMPGRVQLKRRPILKALSEVRKIRAAIAELKRGKYDSADALRWWGKEALGLPAPWIPEEQVWRSRERLLLELLKRPRVPKRSGRPASRRYVLIGALLPYMELKGVGLKVHKQEARRDDIHGEKGQRANEWAPNWWKTFLGYLEGRKPLKNWTWLNTRGYKPKSERALQFTLRGSAVYWAWMKHRRVPPAKAEAILDRFLRKLNLGDFGYDLESAKERVEKWSVILGPNELRESVPCP